MLDAFDKRLATEGGSGSVIVVIGEAGERSCGRSGSNAHMVQEIVRSRDPGPPD
jgi:hypothetical protein